MDESNKKTTEETTASVNTVDAAGKIPFQDELEITGFKGFLKGNLPIMKNAGMIIVINVLFSLIGLVALVFDSSKLWLGWLLYLMFIGCEIIFTVLMGKTAAYTAFNTFRLNKVNKKNGRFVPKYKRRQEYHVYKGYVTGVVASIPLIILVLISFFFTGETLTGYSAVVKIIYSLFFSPFALSGAVNLSIGFMLIGVLINAIAFGVGYQFHGMKMQLQQDKIDSEMRAFHSENFDVDGSDETDV